MKNLEGENYKQSKNSINYNIQQVYNDLSIWKKRLEFDSLNTDFYEFFTLM